jgi:aryl-alcohol dehydrogenase
MTIVAAVIETGGAPFRLESLELGPIQADEARVRIAACGICHTDLLIRGGSFPTPMPVVLGHEGAGVVEEVGAAVTRVAPGDRVVLSYASCGTCRTCATGRPYYCAEFRDRNFGGARPDGTTALSRNGQPVHSHFFGQSSFATHAAVTERSLVRLPDDVPFEIAAPLGCGVQTGAGGVLNVLRPSPGAAIAVFGVGGVGLSAVMAAALTGCASIVAVDVKPARLELARELGATHAIDSSETDPVAAIVELTGGGVDGSLETSGAPSALRQAIGCLAPDAICGLIGAAERGTSVPLEVGTILGGGRTLRGIGEGHSVPQVFIPVLLDLWRAGKLPLERLIGGYDFDAINEAAAASEAGTVVKPVLRMG